MFYIGVIFHLHVNLHTHRWSLIPLFVNVVGISTASRYELSFGKKGYKINNWMMKNNIPTKDFNIYLGWRSSHTKKVDSVNF